MLKRGIIGLVLLVSLTSVWAIPKQHLLPLQSIYQLFQLLQTTSLDYHKSTLPISTVTDATTAVQKALQNLQNLTSFVQPTERSAILAYVKNQRTKFAEVIKQNKRVMILQEADILRRQLSIDSAAVSYHLLYKNVPSLLKQYPDNIRLMSIAKSLMQVSAENKLVYSSASFTIPGKITEIYMLDGFIENTLQRPTMPGQSDLYATMSYLRSVDIPEIKKNLNIYLNSFLYAYPTDTRHSVAAYLKKNPKDLASVFQAFVLSSFTSRLSYYTTAAPSGLSHATMQARQYANNMAQELIRLKIGPAELRQFNQMLKSFGVPLNQRIPTRYMDAAMPFSQNTTSHSGTLAISTLQTSQTNKQASIEDAPHYAQKINPPAADLGHQIFGQTG